jgi:aldose 1-epimerase
MLALTSGSSSIVVAPEYGAALTGWMIERTPMLRRALPQATVGGDLHAMGCFPLLPYGNRIGYRRFRWEGVEYTLEPNFGDNPHTIHGVAWQCAWVVEQATPRSATLSFQHRPDPSWPFAFDALVAYDLSDTSLTVTIQMTNRHGGPTPAGIGLHPFFPKAGNPSLRFNATGAWDSGPDALPLTHGPCRPDLLHAEPRAVRDSRLDHCFTGWDGTADILAGAASLRIEASEIFGPLQVFTPFWADFFCVEPVSHVPDAINRRDLAPGQAMHVLRPDETLSGTIRFSAPGTPASASPGTIGTRSGSPRSG